MAGADNTAPEGKHSPIGNDDTSLRQRVEAKAASHLEGDLAKPKRQRRPEITAQHEFVANGEHKRHVPRRGTVE